MPEGTRVADELAAMVTRLMLALKGVGALGGCTAQSRNPLCPDCIVADAADVLELHGYPVPGEHP